MLDFEPPPWRNNRGLKPEHVGLASHELCPKPDRDADIVRIPIFHHQPTCTLSPLVFLRDPPVEKGGERGLQWKSQVGERGGLCARHAFPFYVSFVTYLHFRQDFNLCCPLPLLSLPATLHPFSSSLQCPFAYFVRRLRRRRRPDITFQTLMNQKWKESAFIFFSFSIPVSFSLFNFTRRIPTFFKEFKLARHVNCHTTRVSRSLVGIL